MGTVSNRFTMCKIEEEKETSYFDLRVTLLIEHFAFIIFFGSLSRIYIVVRTCFLSAVILLPQLVIKFD